MTRRSLLAGAPVVFAACDPGDGEYFRRIEPPGSQRLIFHIEAEPETLDPAKSEGGSEEFILPSLFEGLLTLHPHTNELLPGIATNYECDPAATRFVFYLRGNPRPAGIRVGDAPDRTLPARWSDGTLITAHDFVYSWRRALDSGTAAPMASLLYCIRNAEDISVGRRATDELAVWAIDDFTLRVEMRSSTAYFPQLHDNFIFCAVPAHLIGKFGPAWTAPKHLATNGAFLLAKWKRGEEIALRRNTGYYGAGSVQLEEVLLRPVRSRAASINLYKAGDCDWLPGKLLSPIVLPSLEHRKDFHVSPAFWCLFYAINTRLPPFDNVLVRYALNMATDKRAIANFAGAGRTPASSFIPECEGYHGISALPIEISGSEYDIIKYDPPAARHLLSRAGVDSLRVEIQYPNHPATADLLQILQQQWRRTLGAEVRLTPQEEKVWIRSRGALAYKGLSERGCVADYLDPNAFLEAFLSGPNLIGSGWLDARYDAMVSQANATIGVSERMRRLADCEKFLLRELPILPLYHNVFSYLRKPYVHGIEPRRLGLIRFKYVWIDRNWRTG